MAGEMEVLMTGAKVASTAIPSAVAVDIGLQMGNAPNWRPVNRELARTGLGALLTLGAAMLGAPAVYAVGPLVGNGTVAGVNVSRTYDLAGKLRNSYAPH